MKRFTVYLLMVAVFLTATSELVVAGILSVLAEELHVSVALAGQLITAYSLAFATGTPVIISLTSRMGRKKLLLFAMAAFLVGNLVSFVSDAFALLIAARVILGISSGVLMVAAFSTASKLVSPERIGSAVGTIILGFSLAMILGVPIGIKLTDWFGWQTIFLLLAIAGLIIILLMALLLPESEGDAPAPFSRQLSVLANPVILFALIYVLFREIGNSVMFTYVTAFMEEILQRSASDIAFIMLAFGIAGAVGSRLGGSAADRFGSEKVMLISIIGHIVALALLPLAIQSLPLAIGLLSLWVISMFMSGPASQTFFLKKSPESANLIISLNTSITQVGLAAGAGLGGMAVTMNATVLYNPWVASAALLLAAAAALVSVRRSTHKLAAAA
ncbi:MFS transporter [Paenibacillus soyae]|uniref:MFS transporter n=1 Tax=Paenibacillus soyae TaxID=2969249 RepID=A0A9X2MSZ8_9BACL|nr:MFS transporter [Paenibacillus soyae]MCR2805890.1 MFS transporter [Paenibacillus soyae]